MNRPLIVGGGPAGSAAAIVLAQGGTSAMLIERTREPHDMVCGGFLARDALDALAGLGIDPHALGARPITRLRLIAGGRTSESALPFAAAGLSRRTLDAALLAAAHAAGAGIERGVSVREARGTEIRLDDDTLLAPPALFLATGKHELRGLARPRDAGGDDPGIGLRARLTGRALAAAIAGTIELHLFPHGYAGLLVQEDGAVNLCLSTRRSRMKAGQGAFLAGLAGNAPRLAERIAAADGVPAWNAIAGVPYGWRTREGTPGLFRLGDQAAVIPSLAGDGVAIALSSGRSAAAHFLHGGAAAAPAFQRAFAGRAAPPLRWAGTLRYIAEGPFAALLPMLATVPGLAATMARLTRIERRTAVEQPLTGDIAIPR